MVRKGLLSRLKATVLTGCFVLVLTACQSGGVGATPGIDAASLIVGLDEVQRVTDRDDLAALPVMDAPRSFHENLRTPDQCRPVFGLEEAFGHNWSQFRSATYTAAGGEISAISTVAQAIGVYPDDGTARAEFDRLASSFEDCAALQTKLYNFRINKLDPSTVALVFPGNSQTVTYRVTASVLIDVVVQGLPGSERIAETVSQMISERVT
ncbi:sensor domain-containing protein [Mycobacterium sp. SMC-15]|uniref:sensor domain-containing protein n=1 Tax=Mycobacterium sp. SMC-15 TaxID=3381627 RepID=UPI0038760B0C